MLFILHSFNLYQLQTPSFLNPIGGGSDLASTDLSAVVQQQQQQQQQRQQQAAPVNKQDRAAAIKKQM